MCDDVGLAWVVAAAAPPGPQGVSRAGDRPTVSVISAQRRPRPGAGPPTAAAAVELYQIAIEVAYTNRGTAYNVVTQALAVRQAHSVDHRRDLELARLEAAHAALWPRAMQGHVPSVAAVLRILDLQCRLQGLYEPAAKPGPKDHWDHCEGPPPLPSDRSMHYVELQLVCKQHPEGERPILGAWWIESHFPALARRGQRSVPVPPTDSWKHNRLKRLRGHAASPFLMWMRRSA